MLKVVIIGGKLQGSEVAYLGREAGYEVILIDKNPDSPAQKLCNRFICADITDLTDEIGDLLKTADIIIPTMENYDVLEYIVNLCGRTGLPLAFDWAAYKVSCSKKTSNILFNKIKLPIPEHYPLGKYPYIAKPSGESGSHGVVMINNEKELEKFLKTNKKDYIIQEYIKGPSYSVEIIGTPGNYRTYLPTEILTDEGYDCNQVVSSRDIDIQVKNRLSELAVQAAEAVELKGIMDLEVIASGQNIRILEIDARFPSQTPIVVYNASGMNYVKELYDLFINGNFQDPLTDIGKHATLIHYYINKGEYVSLGEHIMVEGGLLDYTADICSDTVVISDYAEGKKNWRGMFISCADSSKELSVKSEIVRMELNKMIMYENKDTVIQRQKGEKTGG